MLKLLVGDELIQGVGLPLAELTELEQGYKVDNKKLPCQNWEAGMSRLTEVERSQHASLLLPRNVLVWSIREWVSSGSGGGERPQEQVGFASRRQRSLCFGG